MAKLVNANELIKLFKNGQTIMVGGFLTCGSPSIMIDELLNTDIKDLILIANDTSIPTSDRGKLVVANKIKKAIVSHIGTNPETVSQFNNGTLEVELVPQGSLAEKIRAGGAGLGGILTPVGINTEIQKGKDIINVDGKDFILEKPLTADIAIIYATNGDKFGNLSFYGSTKNFNAIMAPAAKIVIAEIDNLLKDAIDPNNVVVPGIFVDYLILKDKK